MVAVESIIFEGRLSELLPDGSDWREHAVCKGRTRLFFPPKAERPQARARREAQARLLCSTCPVQANCQQFARANHELRIEIVFEEPAFLTRLDRIDCGAGAEPRADGSAIAAAGERGVRRAIAP